MKKIFSKLILPIMAIGLFAACDDVPSPYYVLSPEEVITTIEGEGTSEVPYTVNDALTIINAGTYTAANVYVEGIITQIDNIDTSYGNATYYIADEADIDEDGAVKQQLEVYRGSYLNGNKFTSTDQMKVGDHVIVYGQITLYGSTPEITQGSMVYMHNGVYSEKQESDATPAGSGTYEDPYNVAKAKEIISAGTYTSDKVYVKGIVSKIDDIGNTYGNATYFISDDGTAAGQLEVYRGFGMNGSKLTADDLQVGDELIVYGVLTLYGSTAEITQGSSIVYQNGQGNKPDTPTPGVASGDGTLENPYNSVAANELANSLSDNTNSSNVYIKGKVVSIKENYTTQYGNATFYISDDGTSDNQLYVYRCLYLGNAKYTSGDVLKEGDDVIIYGQVTKYVNNYGTTLETAQNAAYLYSLNGKTGDNPTPGTSGQATGDGSLQNPYNSVAANQVASALAADATTSGEVYVKGKVVSISQNYDYNNAQYGNITCYISDDGTTTDQFYIFRALYFNKEQYTSGLVPNKGDEIVICGKLTNYKGNTPETVQKEAYLYSINGQTSGGNDNPNPDPDPTPSGDYEGQGTMNSPYTVADAQKVYESAGGTAKSAYVCGYIVGYVDGNSFNANTATFSYPTAQETEVLIADSKEETDFTKCVPVQLPKGEFRDGLDLYSQQMNMKAYVVIYGSIEKYFGVCGIKSPSYAQTDWGLTIGSAPGAKRR